MAWPAAFLITRKWLDQFAYRIDLPISAFLIASLVAGLIACGAIATQSLRVARTKPVTALRSE